MILNATFLYGADVRPPRARNHRHRGFLATIPVEVAEATPEEAPVALRVHEDGELPMDYRLHGGRLWLADPPDGDEPARDAAWLAREAANWRGDRFRTPLATGHRENYEDRSRRIHVDEVLGTVEGDPGVAAVIASDREARAAEVRAAAADVLLVGGMVHRARAEPVYVHHREFIDIQRMDARNHSDDIYFRADERGLMEDSPRSRGRLPDLPRIDVLVPEAVRAPLPHLTLLSEAGSLDHAIAGDHDRLKAMSVSSFAAYAALRDALARGRRSVEAEGDAADLSEIAAAFGPLVDAYEEDARARGWPGYESYRRSFDLALDRYEAFRAAAPDIAPPSGP